MRDTGTRLTDCFAAVFPDLEAAELQRASTESMPAWDSLAMATLIAIVEEEFEVAIPLDDFSNLNSYQAFLEFAKTHAPPG
jgi:acyl carrier protein